MVPSAKTGERKWSEDELETLQACPVCGNSARSLLHEKLIDGVFFCSADTWTMYRCDECKVAYLNPRAKLETIGKAYTTYYTHADGPKDTPDAQTVSFKSNLRAKIRNGYINKRYNVDIKPGLPLSSLLASRMPLLRSDADRSMRLLRLPHPGARLLDVGCGSGEFLLRMRQLGWNVAGLDFDQAAVDACGQAGIVVQTSTLEDAGYQECSFDAITLSHVIEHLHDPIATLQYCFRLLKPDGSLYVETPSIDSVGHTQFGPYWRGLEPPRHLTLFTPSALQRACERIGFEVKQVQGVPTFLWMYQQSSAIKQGVNPYEPTFWESVTQQQIDRFYQQDIENISNPAHSEFFMLLAIKK